MRTITIPVPALGSRSRWAAVGLATGLLAASIASPLFASPRVLAVDPAPAPEHTISVTGTGRVIVSPDIADLQLGVAATKPTVKAAREAAAVAMTSVIKALKGLGIADADIQTSTLSLQPVYDYSATGKAPKITGYTLSNSVSVTVRDLDKVGDAIDQSLAAGATTLDGVTFRVDDPAKAEQQAREAAIKEARARADTLASGAGVAITGVASISETSAPVPYPVYFGAERAAGVAADTATPVQAGTNQVTVTVSVSYLID